jgi:hypothetical protein
MNALRATGSGQGDPVGRLVSLAALAAVLSALLMSCVPLPPGAAGGLQPGGAALPGEGFAVYLLPGVRSADLAGLDLASLALTGPPFLAGDDIIGYTPASHDLELTLDAFRRVQDLFAAPVPVSGVPFVVTVDRQPVYVGAFWTMLSSLSFAGVVIMEPMILPHEAPEHPTIRIDLGYPGPDLFVGPDPRNDPRILAAFEAAGKLR